MHCISQVNLIGIELTTFFYNNEYCLDRVRVVEVDHDLDIVIVDVEVLVMHMIK